jgi:hypothetical protein
VASFETRRDRLIVAGSRDFTEDPAVIRRVLGLLHGGLVMVHGANYSRPTSVDLLAKQWWHDLGGLDHDPHPADWDGPCGSHCPPGHRKRNAHGEYCPFAGFARNEQMAVDGARGMLAFPGGHGTEDMVERAHVHDIPVLRVEP